MQIYMKKVLQCRNPNTEVSYISDGHGQKEQSRIFTYHQRR